MVVHWWGGICEGFIWWGGLGVRTPRTPIYFDQTTNIPVPRGTKPPTTYCHVLKHHSTTSANQQLPCHHIPH
jgi:hypothetical protein